MRPFNWHEIWAPKWPPVEVIFRTLIVYLFVQILFRLSGRKEWTGYSAFNATVLFLIAVALRTTILGDDYSITSGLIAISTLISIDWCFSYFSFRSEKAANLLQGKIVYLVRAGELQKNSMRKAKISKSRLLAEIRLKGHKSIDDVQEACLERSGQISFIFKPSTSSQQKNQAA